MARKLVYTDKDGRVQIFTEQSAIPIKASTGGLSDVSEYLYNMGQNISNIENFVMNIDAKFTRKEVENNILKKAFNLTVNDLGKRVKQIITEAIKFAAIQTKEFDYPPYLKAIERAVSHNWLEMVSITYNNNGIHTLEIDISPLGHISEWGNAVKKTRVENKWGKMPEPRRSDIWAEKIYGVEREGVRVIKKVKKGKNKGTKDITGKYSDLYALTVIERLSRVRANTAPFVHLIRLGNVSLGVSDEGGRAYPTFPGFDFVPLIEQRIRTLFTALFDKYLSMITSRYDTFLSQVGISASARGLGAELSNRVSVLLEKIDRKELAEQVGQKSFERIRTEGGETQFYLTKKLKLAARRFLINEAGKHKQISYKYSVEGK